jgi:hypothetical protein
VNEGGRSSLNEILLGEFREKNLRKENADRRA